MIFITYALTLFDEVNINGNISFIYIFQEWKSTPHSMPAVGPCQSHLL